MFKSMCKREKFDEVESYLERLVSQGKAVDGRAWGIVSSKRIVREGCLRMQGG